LRAQLEDCGTAQRNKLLLNSGAEAMPAGEIRSPPQYLYM